LIGSDLVRECTGIEMKEDHLQRYLGVMPSHADKRVALIIGNSPHAHVPHLSYPAREDGGMAAALKARRF